MKRPWLGLALSVLCVGLFPVGAAQAQTAEAIDHYQQALRLRPAAAVYLNLASALLKLPGRAGEAAAQLQSALQLDPGNAAARQLLDRIRAFPP